MNQDFDAFFKANENRIHFQIQRLGIAHSLYGEFYSEGIFALWRAYNDYEREKGHVGTFLNYQIRYRLIDLIRKKVREQKGEQEVMLGQKVKLDDGNRHVSTDSPIADTSGIIIENKAFWNEVRQSLTDKQWKWVHYFIIANLTVKEICEIENVTPHAVTSWGRQVRKNLKHDHIRKKLEELI